MRAIATGKRGGALPGFRTGFTLGLGSAWAKQTGAGSLRTVRCTPKRTPQGLRGIEDGHALRMWRRVCKATGTRYKYTLHLGVRRYITVKGLTIYIDHENGRYNHNWCSSAIPMIRKAR